MYSYQRVSTYCSLRGPWLDWLKPTIGLHRDSEGWWWYHLGRWRSLVGSDWDGNGCLLGRQCRWKVRMKLLLSQSQMSFYESLWWKIPTWWISPLYLLFKIILFGITRGVRTCQDGILSHNPRIDDQFYQHSRLRKGHFFPFHFFIRCLLDWFVYHGNGHVTDTQSSRQSTTQKSCCFATRHEPGRSQETTALKFAGFSSPQEESHIIDEVLSGSLIGVLHFVISLISFPSASPIGGRNLPFGYDFVPSASESLQITVCRK